MTTGNQGFLFMTAMILIIAAIPFCFYFFANRQTRRAEESYQTFEQLKKVLKSLRKKLAEEAWRWPIYIRPVLYSDIDWQVSMIFSDAERAMYAAEQCRDEMPPLPVPSDNFLDHFRSLWSRIHQANLIIQAVQNLETYTNTASEIIEALVHQHTLEKTLQKQVTNQVKDLENRFNQGYSSQKAIALGMEYEKRLNWVTNVVQNCLASANQHLATPAEDGLNFAMADTFKMIGAYILSHLDLYERQFRISARYDLDHFKHQLEKFEYLLDVIINVAALETWRDLSRTQALLDIAAIKLEFAIKSITDFDRKQQAFTALEKAILKVRFTELREKTTLLENECVRYWYDRQKDPTFWSAALGSHPNPGGQIEEAHRITLSKIGPFIKAGSLVKQSDLPALNANIENVLQILGHTRPDIEALSQLLQVHKKAEKDVWELIHPQGSATLAVRDLEEIEADSSQEIREQCVLCRQDLEMYTNRAKNVQGANFPELLEVVRQLPVISSNIKSEHFKQIDLLVDHCAKIDAAMRKLYQELMMMRNIRPAIDWNWTDLISHLADTIRVYNPKTRRFSELSAFYSQAKNIHDRSAKDADEIRNRRKQFDIYYQATKHALDEMASALAGYEKRARSAWEWERGILNQQCQLIRRDHGEFTRKWEQALSMDTVQKAQEECEALKLSVQKTLDQVTRNLAEVFNKEKGYTLKYAYLLEESSRVGGLHRVSAGTAEQIKTLLQKASQAEEELKVEMYLNTANDLLSSGLGTAEMQEKINELERKANQPTRPTQVIINNLPDVLDEYQRVSYRK